jgi:predicted MFS family arabinose efflux permease
MECSEEKAQAVQFWVLNIASFMGQLTIAMVNLAMVYHLKGFFGLSAENIGWMTSVTTATYVFFCIAGASFCTRFRPRHLIEFSLIGMAVSVAAFALATNLAVAAVCLACFGASMSLLWPQVEGWFSRGKEGRQLSKASNAFNFSWAIGAGLSSVVAGVLVERSTTLPFWIAAVLFVLVFLLIAVASSLVPQMRAVQSERRELETGNRVDASTPLRFYSWIGLVLVYTGMSLILTIFPVYAQDVLGLGASVTGSLLFVRGVTTCFAFLGLALTSFWQLKKRYIFLNQILFSLLCLVGTRIDSVLGFAIFFFAFGIVFAMGYTQSIFHGASGCLNRSRRMIVHEVLLTVGTIFGAVFGGYIYERISFERVLLVFGLIGCIAVLLEASAMAAESGRKRARVLQSSGKSNTL